MAGYCKNACFLFLIILLCAGCSGNDADQSSRPNILLILADDLGNNDIASWGAGEPKTPTLDQLSQQSLRFRSHYTDSSCSVSRAALLSGRDPVSIGFEPIGLGLSEDLETLPRSLKQLGYRTVHVGKWHVGEAKEYPGVWPLQQGFDHWFGMFSHFVLQGPDASGKLENGKPTFLNPWLQLDREPIKKYSGHLDDILTDYALKQIADAKNDKAPWFINLWYLSPHHPYQPAEAFAKQYPDDANGRYLAVLAQLDHNVQRVLQALEQSGQAENTIVVFASDNGSPNIARDSNYPFTGIKVSYREGGVRSPLLIRWPGHLKAGDIEGVTHITDLYPTLLGMAGGEVPGDLSGRNLSDALLAQAPLPKVDALHWAADTAWGQLYGVHFPGRGLFAQDVTGPFSVEAVTGPVNRPVRSETLELSQAQAGELMRDWERKVRPIPLTWQRLSASAGILTGRDFQRAPMIGGFSFGLALGPPSAEQGEQILVEQPGVWSLHLLPEGHLRFRHGETVLLSGAAVSLPRACNTLIASVYLEPASQFPFKKPGTTDVRLFVNQELVLQSSQILTRPSGEAVLRAPTYIGIGADGHDTYSGTVDKTLLIGKHILPGKTGYGLGDMAADLCAP